jgi:hypothetical protein
VTTSALDPVSRLYTAAGSQQVVLGNGVGTVELDIHSGSPLIVAGQTNIGSSGDTGRGSSRTMRRRLRISALLSSAPGFGFSRGPPGGAASSGLVSMPAFVRLADALSAEGAFRPAPRWVLTALARERSTALRALLGAPGDAALAQTDIGNGTVVDHTSGLTTMQWSINGPQDESDAPSSVVAALTPEAAAAALEDTASAGVSMRLQSRVPGLALFQHPWAARAVISQVGGRTCLVERGTDVGDICLSLWGPGGWVQGLYCPALNFPALYYNPYSSAGAHSVGASAAAATDGP